MRTVFDVEVTVRVTMPIEADNTDEEILSDLFTDVINQMLETEDNGYQYKVRSVKQVGVTAWDQTEGPFWDHPDSRGM